MAEIQLQSSDGTVDGNIFINGSGELALREGGGGSQVLLGDNALELPSVDLQLSGGDLTDGTNVIYDQSASEIPESALATISNSTLSNSSVTIEGNSVSLGSSISLNHNDLSSISSDDHHTKYQDSDARSAVESGNLSQIDGENNHRIRFDSNSSWIEITNQSNTRQDLMTNDVYIGNSSTWLGDDHLGVSNAHHSRYSDSEARGAIESGNVSQVSFANIESVPSRSIGIDDSEGPMYADSSGNNYPLWNSKGVNSGSGVSISGGNGAGSTPVTIGLNESNINHNNLNNSNDSDAHHSKTTSASDLTDVSADSVSDAHHAQNHGDGDHEYTLKINGTVIGSGDTVNFKT